MLRKASEFEDESEAEMHQRHQQHNADAEADRQTRRRGGEIRERIMAIASGRISQRQRNESDASNGACSFRQRRKIESVPDRKNETRRRSGHEQEIENSERDRQAGAEDATPQRHVRGAVFAIDARRLIT